LKEKHGEGVQHKRRIVEKKGGLDDWPSADIGTFCRQRNRAQDSIGIRGCGLSSIGRSPGGDGMPCRRQGGGLGMCFFNRRRKMEGYKECLLPLDGGVERQITLFMSIYLSNYILQDDIQRV
jgi:hypothetical protein